MASTALRCHVIFLQRMHLQRIVLPTSRCSPYPDDRIFWTDASGSDPLSVFGCPVRIDKEPQKAVPPAECRALSVLITEIMTGVDEAWLRLEREVKERGLKPVAVSVCWASLRLYAGREIETHRYCSRFVLPVEM